MIKCECGRPWPCGHNPESWHTPADVVIEDGSMKPRFELRETDWPDCLCWEMVSGEPFRSKHFSNTNVMMPGSTVRYSREFFWKVGIK